jgi:hypothetical protein
MFRSPSPTTAEPGPARRRAAAAAAWTALALLAASPGRAALPWSLPFDEGETVRFMGTVTDAEGRAIQGIDVALVAANRKFDFRALTRVPDDVARRDARTDARGEYAIDWPWDSRYREFTIVVFVPVRGPGGEEAIRELARVDVGKRLRQGSPVLAALTVENAAAFYALRDFVAGLSSEDEQRVYAEAGRPDSVERREGAVREAAWWYYGLGRVYRFRAGRLEEVERFDPVRPFGAGGGVS